MKHALLSCCIAALLVASPALAVTTINITQGSGTPFLTFQDGSSNNFSAVGLCGLLCTNEVDINSSHQLLTLDSQSGTWNITNISGTISLPTGASTSALQTTGNSTLTTINTTLGTPMQNTGGTVAATESGTWNITNVSGTVSLPTGAATSALQTTGNTSLNTINTTLGSPMQTTGGSLTANGAVNVTAHDCSGTITSGGVAQNAFTAQTTLHGFTLANIDSTSGSGEPLWFSMTTTAAAATAASYPLAAPTVTTFAGLTSFTAPPGLGLNHALSVIAATTSHAFSCTWW